MTAAVFVAVYAGLLVFVAGCIWRIIQYSAMPLHLRWELYPVPHEQRRRVRHGGSYFESSEWWSHPRHFNGAGELRVMVPEIALLNGVWRSNRRLWYSSFPFHLGLYCSIAAGGLVVCSAVLSILAPPVAYGRIGALVAVLYRATGFAGLGLVLAGASLLLIRRTTSSDLRIYTTAADIFNLCFFIVVFATLGAGYLFRPAGVSVADAAWGLITFDTSVKLGSVLGIGVVLASALVAYMPFTHMSHFIAKYFMYHAVRWDDRPNRPNSGMERRVAASLACRPTWAARHIGADGEKTWGEIAACNPAHEVRK